MNIRNANAADCEALFDIWLRSVRATHTFLAEDDIAGMMPLVREYLATGEDEFWVLSDDGDTPVGFMTLNGNKMEALFLDPSIHRRGGGGQLVRHAQSLKGELTVDVNEQNSGACRFYEACGFKVEGRSELDSTGRPFPLLHLRLAAAKTIADDLTAQSPARELRHAGRFALP
jgi:putative acetyltransferase